MNAVDKVAREMRAAVEQGGVSLSEVDRWANLLEGVLEGEQVYVAMPEHRVDGNKDYLSLFSSDQVAQQHGRLVYRGSFTTRIYHHLSNVEEVDRERG